MRVVVAEFALSMLVATLVSSCGPEISLSSVKRTDITSITVDDCASQRFSITDEKLIDQFWEAISRSTESDITDLKRHTGYARVWVNRRDGVEPIFINIVASIDHGPIVVVYAVHGQFESPQERRQCTECEAFFIDMKQHHAEFNWCQAPIVH